MSSVLPYYEADGVCLYHGDCVSILPELSLDGGVLVSDPPYSMLHKFGQSASTSRYGLRRLEFDFDKRGAAIDAVIESLQIVFPAVSAFHLFTAPEHYGSIAKAARDAGLEPKPWARLKKYPPPPMPGNWWPSAFELAMYGYRSGAWFGDGSGDRKNTYVADGYRHGIRKEEKTDHPTQKWLPMIAYIVSCIVPPDGLTIDPFVGSGTTLIAARMMQRRAIGIEIEERYCEMAANRMRQSDIFAISGAA